MANTDADRPAARHVIERAARLDAWRQQIFTERGQVVDRIASLEAELRAVTKQLTEIDDMLHKGPRSG